MSPGSESGWPASMSPRRSSQRNPSNAGTHFAPARNLFHNAESFFRTEAPAELLRAFPPTAGDFGEQLAGKQHFFHAGCHLSNGIRIEIAQSAAGNLRQAGTVGGDGGSTASHGFDHGETKTF